MDKLNKEEHNEYDNIPVIYCKHCLSIKIMDIDNTDFCDDCGCTDTSITDIFTWEKMYKEKYGKSYLE